MKLVEILNPLLIANLIRKFVEEYKEPQNALIVVNLMRQSLLSTPTYLRAVKRDRDYIAYLWMTVLGGSAFIQQVFSENVRARQILFTDLERWCHLRGITTLAGTRRLDQNTKGFERWAKRQGYAPAQMLYVKRLGGA